jgi:ABC-type transporter Mla maintaining outer membrane lipid asymmetry permease subunit MlaE
VVTYFVTAINPLRRVLCTHIVIPCWVVGMVVGAVAWHEGIVLRDREMGVRHASRRAVTDCVTAINPLWRVLLTQIVIPSSEVGIVRPVVAWHVFILVRDREMDVGHTSGT